MATETILIECPAGAWTLIGEEVTRIAVKIRSQKSSQPGGGTLFNTVGNIKLRMAITTEEPELYTENYWTFSSDDYMDIEVSDSSVYIRPEADNQTVYVEVLRG